MEGFVSVLRHAVHKLHVQHHDQQLPVSRVPSRVQGQDCGECSGLQEGPCAVMISCKHLQIFLNRGGKPQSSTPPLFIAGFEAVQFCEKNDYSWSSCESSLRGRSESSGDFSAIFESVPLSHLNKQNSRHVVFSFVEVNRGFVVAGFLSLHLAVVDDPDSGGAQYLLHVAGGGAVVSGRPRCPHDSHSSQRALFCQKSHDFAGEKDPNGIVANSCTFRFKSTSLEYRQELQKDTLMDVPAITFQRNQMRQKDERFKVMNEVLAGMKVIKLYAWEPSFEEQILNFRQNELFNIKYANYINAFGSMCWLLSPYLVKRH